MNVENLELNKEYTWREICNIINIEFRRGKGQTIDLNRLKELVNLKDNNKTGKAKKYIITDFC